ncbi:response regulator [Deinococcus malanensis]|uniref:response regulator n=1 Tax=Deinococcus malanensis TaxID=1706855 RepID=UPI0036381CFD
MPTHGAAPAGSRLPKILVIEDSPGSTRVVTQVLEEAGFQALTFPDGAAGHSGARDHHPGMIIVDLGIPDDEGEQLIRGFGAPAGCLSWY